MSDILILGISCLLTVISINGKNPFTLTSGAFSDGKPIPVKYANLVVIGGKNISPPLQWSDAPPGTRSFALSVIDVHPVASNWVHWLVINIPKSAKVLPEGASGKHLPKGAVELNNSFDKPGYGGPQPPPGTGSHPYNITLYALSVDKLVLKPQTTLDEFMKAIKGMMLGEAQLTGTYERK